MKLIRERDRASLLLTRDEAEAIVAAIMAALVQSAEEDPLMYWALEGVVGAKSLPSDELAHRIIAFEAIPGPPELRKQFLALGIDEETLDVVMVEKPTDIETIAKIEGAMASDIVMRDVMKKGV
jgi:hypothetical protein